jgi:hypothetical protein
VLINFLIREGYGRDESLASSTQVVKCQKRANSGSNCFLNASSERSNETFLPFPLSSENRKRKRKRKQYLLGAERKFECEALEYKD